MNLNFRSLKTKQLKKNDIKEICKQKYFWNFSLKNKLIGLIKILNKMIYIIVYILIKN